MATYSLTINERTALGKELVQYLSALPHVTFEKTSISSEKKNALDRADDDIKAGRVYKAKDARDLIEQCLR